MSDTSAEVSKVAESITADAPDPTTSGRPSLTGAGTDDTAASPNEDVNGATNTDVDSAGVRYDPAIHSPGRSRKLDGTWRAKRGAAEKSKLALPQAPPPPPGPPPHLSDAQALHATITGVAQMVFGEEWKPSDQESVGMIEATRATLEAYGGFAMPPWMAMAVAYGVWGMTRVHLPKTKTRLDALGGKVARWVAGIKAPFARKMVSPKLTPVKTTMAEAGGTVQKQDVVETPVETPVGLAALTAR